MPKTTTYLICALLAGLGGVASATHHTTIVKKPAKVMTSVVQTGAIVEAVNKKTRELKLIGPKNERFTLIADERIRNFDQIEPRDRIIVSYLESVAIMVAPPGAGQPDFASIGEVAVAAPGDRPGVEGAKTTIITATVEMIDRENQRATLRLPGNEWRTINVHDPAALEMVDVGDEVDVLISTAIAISVEPPPDD
jgi:hypothetical protein